MAPSYVSLNFYGINILRNTDRGHLVSALKKKRQKRTAKKIVKKSQMNCDLKSKRSQTMKAQRRA